MVSVKEKDSVLKESALASIQNMLVSQYKVPGAVNPVCRRGKDYEHEA